MSTRGSCKAHVKNQRKKFVCQQLGVASKCWLTPKSWLLLANLVVFDLIHWFFGTLCVVGGLILFFAQPYSHCRVTVFC